jgi:hypothetical protein
MVPMTTARTGLLLTLLAVAFAAAGCRHSYRQGTRSSGGAGEASTALAPEEVDWLDEVTIPEHLERLDREQELALAKALRDLARDDFGTSSSGMRRIVEFGEPVVPYLGYAGDALAERHREEFEDSCAVILLEPILEEVSSEHIGAHLESPYACVRIAAAEVAGQKRQTEHAGRLIVLLDDPEIEVRRAAIVSLRMLANRFFGYRPSDSTRRRADAVDRWRAFWGIEE